MVRRSFIPISPETGFRALLEINFNTPVRLGTGAKGRRFKWAGRRGKKWEKPHTGAQAERVDHKPKKHPSFIIFAI